MHKVLIAHSSEDVRLTLEDIISSKYKAFSCSNYNQALIYLENEKPDVLILDLSLHGGSAAELLSQSAGHRPEAILATTWFADDSALADLAPLGIDFIMALPGKLGTLIYRLEDILRQKDSEIASAIKGILNKLHIPAHLDGYKMLLKVIPMYIEDPARRLSKEIYPVIAEEMGLNHWKSVDRSIRFAIDQGFLSNERSGWLRYFPDADDSPNISQFLSVIKDQLQENYI